MIFDPPHLIVSTHSHPKVAADFVKILRTGIKRFQHTATRRWLQLNKSDLYAMVGVSTHSHPKVAAIILH